MSSVRTIILFVLLTACISRSVYSAVQVGRGIADITGAAAEGLLYGYANPLQDARGIHLRQYSRAFVFLDTDSGKRVAFIVAEITMSTQALKAQVCEILAAELGNLYTEENIMIQGTHTHSGPGGYHTFWMYASPTGGFINQTFMAYANGIAKSIRTAHEDLQPASLVMGKGEIFNVTLSRSPYSYDQNPEEEKARYPLNVDNNVTVVRINGDQGPLGMINFLGVHTTSMRNFNHLVSSDNKGYAAQLFERYLNPGAFPGQGLILSAFAQTTEGDVTPNIRGDLCDNTCAACSYNTSICPEDPINPKLCNSYGPTGEIFKDTAISGRLQFEKAVELYEAASEVISGPIDFRHIYVNMSAVNISDHFTGEPVTTCRPAMGYSFAAGATDGPGYKPFTQGDTEGISVLDGVIDIVFNMTDVLVECQFPKPVLLPSGEIEIPFPWQPEIIPLQLLRIGNLYLAGLPAEVTTMSGRRLRESIENVLKTNGAASDTEVLLLGLVNDYTSYLTTPEEYSIQRYEGASTSYGPNTLEAYLKLFNEMSEALITGQPLNPGPEPIDLRGYVQEALGPPVTDDTPTGTTHGDVLEDVDPEYFQGEVVTVVFVAGNPRNDLKIDQTFLEVQLLGVSNWTVVYTDAHWETRFHWDSNCQESSLPGGGPLCDRQQISNATIIWETSTIDSPGTYRIAHFGNAKLADESVIPYSGFSSPFELLALN